MIAETLGWARLMRGAGEIVDRLESYTEMSPSGTRLHVLVEGGYRSMGIRTGTWSILWWKRCQSTCDKSEGMEGMDSVYK